MSSLKSSLLIFLLILTSCVTRPSSVPGGCDFAAFRDTQLDALVQGAYKCNPEFQLAKANLCGEKLRAAWRTLAADVARTYIQLCIVQIQEQLALQQSALWEEMNRLNQDLYGRGEISTILLNRDRQAALQLKAAKAGLEKESSHVQHHLYTLTLQQACSNSFPTPPCVHFPCLDRLILSRDDVRAAKGTSCFEYGKVYLAAREEVLNATCAIAIDRMRMQFLAQAVSKSKEAVQLTTDLYKHGFISYSEWVEQKKQDFDIQSAYLEAKGALLLDFVALYQATSCSPF